MTDQPKSASWLICDGLCVTAAEIGIPGYPDAVAYPHPGCPVHDPDVTCQCDSPDRCLSPTHGQISLREALEIRHRQRLAHAQEAENRLGISILPPTGEEVRPPVEGTPITRP